MPFALIALAPELREKPLQIADELLHALDLGREIGVAAVCECRHAHGAGLHTKSPLSSRIAGSLSWQGHTWPLR